MALKRKVWMMSAAVLVVLMVLALFSLFAFAEEEGNGSPGAPETSVAVPEKPENGIPLVIINIDETDLNTDNKGDQYGTIDDMNGSPDHSVRCKGSVQVLLPEGYEGYGESELKADKESGQLILSYIRGRGNSTWMIPSKKPYKIKFEKKQDLFGMGKSKEWALLANSMDMTLMKNRITGWLGSQMDMPFTPQMIPVDVVMKGSRGSVSYLGSYTLSELVAVEENRVAVKELDSGTSSADEADDPNITGGYLISIYGDGQNDDEPRNSVFMTKGGVEYFIREPSYEGDQEETLTEAQNVQRRYISGYIQNVEDLILQLETAGDDESSNQLHNRIDDMMDLTSLADYWLIQEFSINGDAFATSSTYLYKDRNDRLCWGPLWDFDLAWGMQSAETEEDSEEEGDYQYSVDGFNHFSLKWIDLLRENDPQFLQILKDRWALMDRSLGKLTEENGVIDQFQNEIAMSQADNGRLWAEETDTARTPEEYNRVVAQLKNWIDQRRQWFNDHFDKIDIVTITITYKADGEILDTETIREGHPEFMLPEVPEKPGQVFIDWITEDTQESISLFRADRNVTFVPQYISESEVLNPEALYLSKEEDWASLSDSVYQDNMDIRYEPETITFYDVTWSSSDQEIADVDDGGLVTLLKAGDVVITATHRSGASVSYTLHIYDPDTDQPESVTGIKARPDQMTVETGEVRQIRWTLEPEGQILSDTVVTFESNHPEIAEPDMFGVFTGLEPGTAVITVTACPVGSDDGDGEDVEPVTTTCTVTVVEKNKPMPSGGGTTAMYYPVNLSGTFENGSADLSQSRTLKGQQVTVILTPAEGFQAKGVTVTDRNGKEIVVTDDGDGIYTFIMPASAVTVTPVFTKTEGSDSPDIICPKDDTCPITPFVDTDKNEWYHDGIHWAIETGIMNGTGENTFGPLMATSRAMIVTMLWRMEGSPQADGLVTFKDVPEGQWYTDAVKWAGANGIVNGYSEEAFGPMDNVTRGQIAAILFRYAEKKGYDVSKRADLSSYGDRDDISDWAEDALAWTNAEGLFIGVDDTTLAPGRTATRAEFATVLMRFSILTNDNHFLFYR